MMNSILRYFAFLFLLSIAISGYSQEIFNRKAVENQLLKQTTEIEKIEADIAGEEITRQQLLNFRESLRDRREILQDIIQVVTPVFESIKADINDLGPLPEEEEGVKPEPEPANIQKRRAELNNESLVTEGLITQAEALLSKISRMQERIAKIIRGQFISRLLEVQPSPFNKNLRQSIPENIASLYHKVFQPLFKEFQKSGIPLIVSLSIFVILLFGGVLFSRRTLSELPGIEEDGDTEGVKRLPIISRSLLLPMFTTLTGLFIIFQTLLIQEVITNTNEFFIKKSLALIAFTVAIFLVAIRLRHANLIRGTMLRLSCFAGGIFALDAFFLESEQLMDTSLELVIGQSYLVTTLFAIVVIFLSLKILKEKKQQTTYFLPRQLFYILCGIGVVLLGLNLLGYAALSRFVFERVILLFSLLSTVLLSRSLAHPYFEKIIAFLKPAHTNRDEEEHKKLVFFWLSLSLDTVLLFVALPFLAAIFGADQDNIKEWAFRAFFGFQVGTITISIVKISIAIGVFLALLFSTQFIQKILSHKILPKTKLDSSVSQSIIQLLGYIGLIIGLLAGVSAIGFDLTNLALIAGALSVGIGFGLQSIVSNFVSGLILLFERPIKVGDWIVTNSGEGFVKKISVRATEIEDFDRTSIIVPNSELISSSVKNRTYKDKIGRITITIGVSYDSNPHQVKKLLLQCAKENSSVSAFPEPSVLFRDFGDNALIFDLRIFITNMDYFIDVSTQLRLDIWDCFKRAGIEISFPQRDLHIRTAPGLEKIFGQEEEESGEDEKKEGKARRKSKNQKSIDKPKSVNKGKTSESTTDEDSSRDK